MLFSVTPLIANAIRISETDMWMYNSRLGGGRALSGGIDKDIMIATEIFVFLDIV